MSEKYDASEAVEHMRIRRLKKKQRTKKNLVLVIVIIVVSILSYYAVHNQYVKGIIYAGGGKTVVTVEIDSSFVSSQVTFKDRIINCSKGGLTSYNMNGKSDLTNGMKEASAYISAYSEPKIIASDKYMLAYDKSGYSFVVFDENNVISTATFDYKISLMKIYNSGYFLAIAGDSGTKQQVKIFNQTANEFFIWHSGSGNIFDAEITPDNLKLCVSALNLSDGSLGTNLSYFNLNETEPYATSTVNNCLITSIKFFSNQSLLAIADNGIYKFNLYGKEISNYSFNSRRLDKYAFGNDQSVVLAYALDSERNCKIEIINSKCKLKGSYSLENEIEFIDVKNSNILLSRKRSFTIIGSGGRLIRQASTDMDIKKAFFGDNSRIILIGNSQFEIIK